MMLPFILYTPIGKWVTGLSLVLLSLGSFYLANSQLGADRGPQEISQKLDRKVAEFIVEKGLLPPNVRRQRADLEQALRTIKTINPGIDLYWIDNEGRILVSSSAPDQVKRGSIDLYPLRAMLAGHTSLLPLGDDPRDPMRQSYFSAAPIAGEQGTDGYLYIVAAHGEFADSAHNAQTQLLYPVETWFFAIAAMIVLALGWMLMPRPPDRLGQLAAAIVEFKQMMVGEQTPIEKYDSLPYAEEVNFLTSTVKEVSKSTIQQLHTLQQSDFLRRELIANISHDLRNPLTSLQGYLETLQLKSATLTGEQREKYLAIAVKQCYRLSKLVHEFFELAKLECKEAQPKTSDFSLSELARHIVNKFELAANERGVSLEVGGNTIPYFVTADLGMTERVLVNLIDNALRFTPAGGKVTLLLEKLNDKVAVRVSDTGCGIAPKEIPHIFNHFYRLSNAKSYTPDSTGLGLAIVKRILTLHGSDIEVESTVGIGSTFFFCLPLAAGHAARSNRQKNVSSL